VSALTLEEIVDSNFVPSSNEDWESLDFYVTQLFRPTAPIDENSLFAGRIAQVRALLDVIYQPGAHAILFGERGVGKTSLANIINERIIGPAKFTQVVKVSCSPTDIFATIWSNVFFGYEWQGRPAADVIKEAPQPFTIYKIAERLTQRFLIILDEFDRIQDSTTKTLIADTIKYLSDNPARFTIVVVGVGNSIEQLFGSHPSIQRCCEQIRMPRMSPKELTQIIEERLPQLHMTASDEIIERITKFSQGLPGYTHLLGQLSARSAILRRSLDIVVQDLEQAVSRSLEKADESTRKDFYKAIQSTKPDNRYRDVLLACAMAHKNELGQFSASAVCDPYSQIRGAPKGIMDFARHLNAFCNPDRGPALIKSGKQKRFMYHFANPLLEPLVIMIGKHGPAAS
jgi:Cdc6-like AAA superfamily ATPase